jgi:hypothetical protein
MSFDADFGNTAPGWARVLAICDFLHEHTTFKHQATLRWRRDVMRMTPPFQ